MKTTTTIQVVYNMTPQVTCSVGRSVHGLHKSIIQLCFVHLLCKLFGFNKLGMFYLRTVMPRIVNKIWGKIIRRSKQTFS